MAATLVIRRPDPVKDAIDSFRVVRGIIEDSKDRQLQRELLEYQKQRQKAQESAQGIAQELERDRLKLIQRRLLHDEDVLKSEMQRHADRMKKSPGGLSPDKLADLRIDSIKEVNRSLMLAETPEERQKLLDRVEGFLEASLNDSEMAKATAKGIREFWKADKVAPTPEAPKAAPSNSSLGSTVGRGLEAVGGAGESLVQRILGAIRQTASTQAPVNPEDPTGQQGLRPGSGPVAQSPGILGAIRGLPRAPTETGRAPTRSQKKAPAKAPAKATAPPDTVATINPTPEEFRQALIRLRGEDPTFVAQAPQEELERRIAEIVKELRSGRAN